MKSELDRLNDHVQECKKNLERAELRYKRQALWLRLSELQQEQGEVESQLEEIRMKEER